MKSITVQDLRSELESGAADSRLIDVRETFEHEAGRIPEAENIPLASLEDALPRLKEIGTVYVHCQRGGRSSRACSALTEAGVNAVNVEGGIQAWEEAGYPVLRG